MDWREHLRAAAPASEQPTSGDAIARPRTLDELARVVQLAEIGRASCRERVCLVV